MNAHCQINGLQMRAAKILPGFKFLVCVNYPLKLKDPTLYRRIKAHIRVVNKYCKISDSDKAVFLGKTVSFMVLQYMYFKYYSMWSSLILYQDSLMAKGNSSYGTCIIEL